jgi:hypothetical protein
MTVSVSDEVWRAIKVTCLEKGISFQGWAERVINEELSKIPELVELLKKDSPPIGFDGETYHL